MVGSRLIGEGAKGAADRIDDVLQRRGFQRDRHVLAGTAALDQSDPDAAEDRRAQPLRLLARQDRRHSRSQRIAHDVRALDSQIIQQRDDVTCHDRNFVSSGIVELIGIAMAAIVERDHAAAVFPQIGNPGRINPIHVLAGGKAMHEDDRIALAFVEISNFDSAVVKTRHHQFHFSGDRKWTALQ
ncbi:hypothetical protein CQ13_23645 [Bradyrhizobium retamae]|uniref:Uncharacterized protein n=1 Tax=Bradyrhizobium retamae TaxID=1300035 RepID=A0A0R3N253_9BRAD|nr:hypothetical protein CQ13_23645 [Bradyrhizobium retamae]